MALPRPPFAPVTMIVPFELAMVRITTLMTIPWVDDESGLCRLPDLWFHCGESFSSLSVQGGLMRDVARTESSILTSTTDA